MRLDEADLGIYAAGLVDVEAPDDQSRHPLGYVQLGDQAKAAAAGRFVPARSFPEVPNVPNWKDFAPRFSAVYDLTGDAKTALKGSIKQIQPRLHHRLRQPLRSARAAERHAQLVRLRLPARHVHLLAAWRCRPIATASRRTTRSGRATTGTSASSPTRRADPDARSGRYDIEYASASPGRSLNGVSVTGAWYRRDTYNLEQQLNTLVSVSDYACVRRRRVRSTASR